MHRLLILSCSERKRPDPGYLPAAERYDGPAFRVLRRYLCESRFADQLDVYILSAFYGLIPANYPIVYYDQKMTRERADQLRGQVLNTFFNILNPNYGSLCFAMSRLYLLALEGWETALPPGLKVTVIMGSQGVRLAQLKRWLWSQ